MFKFNDLFERFLRSRSLVRRGINLTRRTLVMDQDFIDLLEWIKLKTERKNHGEVIQVAVKLLAILIEEEEKGNSILSKLKVGSVNRPGNVLPFKPKGVN